MPSLKEKITGLPFLQLLEKRGQTPKVDIVPSIDSDVLGRYYHNPNTIEIAKGAASNPRAFKDVLLHEMGHSFQNNTIGMGGDPVDMAIRKRLDISQKDPGLDRAMQEIFANYIGPNQVGNPDPLTQMIARSMANRAFNAR